MKYFIHLICLLLLTSIYIVVSRRQIFSKSRRARPRGSRHHIFKNANPARIQNNSKTTKVTKIVTVNGNGQESVKQFKKQDEFTDYQMDHDHRNSNWKQQHHYHSSQNSYQGPNFPNPSIHNSYPPSPNQHPNSNVHPPNPYSEQHCNSACEMSLKPWLLPKYKEYTTECCTTLNVSTTDQSQNVVRGITQNHSNIFRASPPNTNFLETLGIYVFDRYTYDNWVMMKPLYVKDTNDFVLYYRTVRTVLKKPL